jgi:hypothetical protein
MCDLLWSDPDGSSLPFLFIGNLRRADFPLPFSSPLPPQISKAGASRQGELVSCLEVCHALHLPSSSLREAASKATKRNALSLTSFDHDGVLQPTSSPPSTIQTPSTSSRVPTSSSWKVTSSCSTRRSSPFGRVRPSFCLFPPPPFLLLSFSLPFSFILLSHTWFYCSSSVWVGTAPNYCYRCGNVASILELDEDMRQEYKVFDAAPQDPKGAPAKRPVPEYCSYYVSSSLLQLASFFSLTLSGELIYSFPSCLFNLLQSCSPCPSPSCLLHLRCLLSHGFSEADLRSRLGSFPAIRATAGRFFMYTNLVLVSFLYT